jgi:hypothetical protein
MVLAYSDRISPVPPYSCIPVYTLRVRDYHPLRSHPFQIRSTLYIQLLGSTAFARHYLRYNYCSLFLRLLRCFSSPGFLPSRDYRSSTCRVAPFGHLRINARLQLPVAFRSLPRPSSSLRAKASTIRSYLLPILIFLSRHVSYILHTLHNSLSITYSTLRVSTLLFSPALSMNFLLLLTDLFNHSFMIIQILSVYFSLFYFYFNLRPLFILSPL